MSDLLIQWPAAKYWDKCWNPVIGCRPVSPACEHCYARAWSNRFGKNFNPHNSPKPPPQNGVVFVGNMTDIFGEFVDCPSDYILQTVKNKAATFLYLTKRVSRMCDRLRDNLGFVDEEGKVYFRHYYDFGVENHYFGFTAENQEWYDKRIKDFRAGMPSWANGWLSAEPLLGPISMGLRYIAPEDMPFKWVVVGCESGPRRRRCDIWWIESIVKQCMEAHIPVFVKQIFWNGKFERDITKFPKHLQIRQVPWAKKGEVK